MSESKEGLTITVVGYETERVKTWIDDQIGQTVTKAIDEKVNDAIAAKVDSLVNELTRARLKAEIDRLLDEGWKETDRWGNETGRVYSLAERVRGVFEAKSDSYNSTTMVTKWVKEAVDYKLAEALKEELASARTRLRAAFDEVLQAKFSATLREALGLKA